LCLQGAAASHANRREIAEKEASNHNYFFLLVNGGDRWS
jgi:hypothetical protein